MLLMKHVRVTLKVFGSPRITQNDPYRGEKEGQWRRLGGTRPPHQEIARPPPRPPRTPKAALGGGQEYQKMVRNRH